MLPPTCIRVVAMNCSFVFAIWSAVVACATAAWKWAKRRCSSHVKDGLRKLEDEAEGHDKPTCAPDSSANDRPYGQSNQTVAQGPSAPPVEVHVHATGIASPPPPYVRSCCARFFETRAEHDMCAHMQAPGAPLNGDSGESQQRHQVRRQHVHQTLAECKRRKLQGPNESAEKRKRRVLFLGTSGADVNAVLQAVWPNDNAAWNGDLETRFTPQCVIMSCEKNAESIAPDDWGTLVRSVLSASGGSELHRVYFCVHVLMQPDQRVKDAFIAAESSFSMAREHVCLVITGRPDLAPHAREKYEILWTVNPFRTLPVYSDTIAFHHEVLGTQ